MVWTRHYTAKRLENAHSTLRRQWQSLRMGRVSLLPVKNKNVANIQAVSSTIGLFSDSYTLFLTHGVHFAVDGEIWREKD